MIDEMNNPLAGGSDYSEINFESRSEKSSLFEAR